MIFKHPEKLSGINLELAFSKDDLQWDTENDDTVRIYYSAKGMYVKTATAKSEDLIALCKRELE